VAFMALGESQAFANGRIKFWRIAGQSMGDIAEFCGRRAGNRRSFAGMRRECIGHGSLILRCESALFLLLRF
jgi:hypothetical protein